VTPRERADAIVRRMADSSAPLNLENAITSAIEAAVAEERTKTDAALEALAAWIFDAGLNSDGRRWAEASKQERAYSLARAAEMAHRFSTASRETKSNG